MLTMNSDAVRARDCGAAFAPGAAEALAETLRAWSRDRAIPTRLGTNARQTYQENFTPTAALAGWEALLRRLSEPA